MAVNLPITVDPSNAEAGLKAIGDEAVKQGGRIEDGFDQAGGGIANATKEVDKLNEAQKKVARTEDDLSASRQVAMMRAGESAKNFAEGLGQFAEVYARTANLNEALDATGEKVTAALAVMNPMAGVLAAAAIAGVKLYGTFSTSAVEAKKAAEATAKLKSDMEAAAKAISDAATSTAKLAGSITDGGDAADAAAATAKQIEAIAVTRRIMAEQMDKDIPEALKKEYEGQVKALNVEESRLKVQHSILNARHLELSTNDTAYAKQAESMKAAEKKMQDIHKGAMQSITQRMAKENELAKDQKELATEKSDLDKKFEKDLQSLIEKTQKKLRDNHRAFKEDNKERQEAYKDLEEAENKLEEHRQQMHTDELARIKEVEQKAIESLQRRQQAEIEMQQGIWRAEEKHEDEKKNRQKGDAGVKDLAGQLGEGADDPEVVRRRFIKDRMEAAERDRKAGAGQARARAEEDARNLGQSDEEVAKEGARAEAAANRKSKLDIARARTQANEDWKKFQRGEGKFDTSKSDANDGVEDDAEKAVRETGNEIGAARQNVVTENVDAANKAMSRQHGLSKQQIAAQKEAMKIAEEIAREQAAMGGEISEIREWQKSVAAGAKANQEAGNKRRRERHSS